MATVRDGLQDATTFENKTNMIGSVCSTPHANISARYRLARFLQRRKGPGFCIAEALPIPHIIRGDLPDKASSRRIGEQLAQNPQKQGALINGTCHGKSNTCDPQNSHYLGLPDSLKARPQTSPQRPRSRQCVICGISKPVCKFPQKTTSTCEHQPESCSECVQTWIKTCLSVRRFDQLVCAQCPEPLHHEDVFRCASREVFENYERVATRAALSSLRDFVWCRNAGCASGQIHVDAPGESIFTCTACGFQFCRRHEVPWHKGRTCEEFDAEKRSNSRRVREAREEAATRALMDETSKKCPGRDCAWSIEKDDGCDHMTCTKCRHEFCWTCLAPYTPIRLRGNRMHHRDCRWFS